MKLHKLSWLLLVLLVLAPVLLPAQEVQLQHVIGVLKYELDSTSVIFCRSSGFVPGANFVETSGSSTTVTAVTGTPFDPLAVGDFIYVAQIEARRRVTAKASGASITVDSAVNLDRDSGYPFQYLAFTCGTTAEDGWMHIGQFGREATVVVEINQMNATSIDVRWEARSDVPESKAVQIYPASSGSSDKCGSGTHASGYCNFTAAADPGSRVAIVVGEPWYQVRVGFKVNTDDGGDTGANAEQINVYVIGRR